MAYSEDEIRFFLSNGENRSVEFKTRLNDSSILSKLISAFANSEGGIIIIGISDQGEIVGAELQEVVKTFHLALAHLINQPKIDLESTLIDGKSIVTITVGKSDQITVSDYGAFIRSDSSVLTLQSDQIERKLKTKDTNLNYAKSLGESIPRLTEQIIILQKEIKASNSFKGQIKNYLYGGLIGAIIGVLLSLIIG